MHQLGLQSMLIYSSIFLKVPVSNTRIGCISRDGYGDINLKIHEKHAIKSTYPYPSYIGYTRMQAMYTTVFRLLSYAY